MNLTKAEIRKEYVIRDIAIDDEELEDFLFTAVRLSLSSPI